MEFAFFMKNSAKMGIFGALMIFRCVCTLFDFAKFCKHHYADHVDCWP